MSIRIAHSGTRSADEGSSRRGVVRADGRKADLAAIHVAKKSLKWSDDEYRDIMATVCGGVRSAADLDIAGRKRFLAHLRACARANGSAGSKGGRSDRRKLSDIERKMWSLWMELADAGLVESRTMPALNAWVKRTTQVDRIEWLNGAQAYTVVESLKRWLERGGPHGTQG